MPQVGLKKMNAMIEVSQIESKMCGHCKELYDRIQHKNSFFCSWFLAVLPRLYYCYCYYYYYCCYYNNKLQKTGILGIVRILWKVLM